MNQVQIQKETNKEQRMLEKANFLVANKRVRRSPVKESRNIWMAGSNSTPKKWYIVRWDEELDLFSCACEAYKYSPDNRCLHLCAVALFEGNTD